MYLLLDILPAGYDKGLNRASYGMADFRAENLLLVFTKYAGGALTTISKRSGYKI
jgi:hypothetical protein